MYVRTFNTSQTAYSLSCAYSGPWLMPEVVTLTKDEKGLISAKGDLTITKDNPFIKMHPHGFPGVMTAEFTQQLGFMIAKEALKMDGLPFMLELNVKTKLAIQIGDTVTAETRLIKVKGRGSRIQFLFESTVTKDGKIVMETNFYGMPVPIRNRPKN